MRVLRGERRVGRFAALAALAAAVACTSPEAARERGGFAGADIGNRGAAIEIHAGALMYHRTDCEIAGFDCEGPPPVFGPAPAFE